MTASMEPGLIMTGKHLGDGVVPSLVRDDASMEPGLIMTGKGQGPK